MPDSTIVLKIKVMKRCFANVHGCLQGCSVRHTYVDVLQDHVSASAKLSVGMAVVKLSDLTPNKNTHLDLPLLQAHTGSLQVQVEYVP